MSKPDWVDAPYWATYLAQDGAPSYWWWWHSTKPTIRRERWANLDSMAPAALGSDQINWRESLEARP